MALSLKQSERSRVSRDAAKELADHFKASLGSKLMAAMRMEDRVYKSSQTRDEYNRAMRDLIEEAKKEGIEKVTPNLIHRPERKPNAEPVTEKKAIPNRQADPQGVQLTEAERQIREVRKRRQNSATSREDKTGRPWKQRLTLNDKYRDEYEKLTQSDSSQVVSASCSLSSPEVLRVLEARASESFKYEIMNDKLLLTFNAHCQNDSFTVLTCLNPLYCIVREGGGQEEEDPFQEYRKLDFWRRVVSDVEPLGGGRKMQLAESACCSDVLRKCYKLKGGEEALVMFLECCFQQFNLETVK